MGVRDRRGRGGVGVPPDGLEQPLRFADALEHDLTAIAEGQILALGEVADHARAQHLAALGLGAE
ncbi:MAG TPA: hypothetical protein DEV96_05280, partial [Rhodospirillum rubrum]|nr:hypothetical protein [Rhodospirillum rubrum]